MTKRERRLLNELQLVTGVLTDDIPYLCFLLLKDGKYFDDIKTDEEKNIEDNERKLMQSVENLEALSFEDFLDSI